MPTGMPEVAVLRAAKPWWRSRTLWVNAIVLALVAAEGHVGVLQGVLPAKFYAWVAYGLPIVNAVLRLITQQPLRGAEPAPVIDRAQGPAQ
jgi:hypothetical protein